MEVQVDRYTLLPCTTKRRITTNLKTKKQPELPENQAVWKSNNQGVKEETFRLAGRVETGSWSTGHAMRWRLTDWGG